jgi:hypothetical protein
MNLSLENKKLKKWYIHCICEKNFIWNIAVEHLIVFDR